MAKDPAFLFYPGDWIGGTMYLNFEQKGAYFELLILQFHVGEFTKVQAQQVLNSHFDSIWPVIMDKFKTDGTIFWNDRLKQEVDKRRAFSESRRNNRINGLKDKEINNSSSSDTSYDSSSDEHMENENRNTVTIEDKKKKLDLRAIEFKKTFKPFMSQYPVDMIKEFYEYWIEPNHSYTKMRFELEKTWSLSRRLGTWGKGNKKFSEPVIKKNIL